MSTGKVSLATNKSRAVKGDMKAWWRRQPEPKAPYAAFCRRIHKGQTYKDAIHPSTISDMMGWWKKQPEPKATCSAFLQCIKEGKTYEDAIQLGATNDYRRIPLNEE